MKRVLSLSLALLLALFSMALLFSCGTGLPKGYEASDEATNYVYMTVKDYGGILIELYPDTAPITVANFQKLVSQKFYDGLTFHRIVKGFMIQGGAPKENGSGGSSETIKGEFSANGVDNPLKHTRGVISMARSNDNDSASSQFFIMHADNSSLDGNYAAFGKVISGMETVDKIAESETVFGLSMEKSKPVKTITITSVIFVKKV